MACGALIQMGPSESTSWIQERGAQQRMLSPPGLRNFILWRKVKSLFFHLPYVNFSTIFTKKKQTSLGTLNTTCFSSLAMIWGFKKCRLYKQSLKWSQTHTSMQVYEISSLAYRFFGFTSHQKRSFLTWDCSQVFISYNHINKERWVFPFLLSYKSSLV